ncbi:MAG: lipase family protein [Solirubrobacteraceae bacterium]
MSQSPVVCVTSPPAVGPGARPSGRSRRRACWAIAWAILLVGGLAAPSGARASVPTPAQDPFYTYTGATPLAEIAPGTVLKVRTLEYHIFTISTPISVVQLLYRTTGALGQPTVNVTSVLKPPSAPATPRVIAYESFYDSLSTGDDPSYAISGGYSLGSAIPNVEAGLIVPGLLAGDTIVDADSEGESADFAAGPVYGMASLDSLRAALRAPATGLAATRQIGIVGYSGGAIGAEWAAELAPSYAPEINRRLVGTSIGGVLVDPAHNLTYVNGSTIWAGVMPMAVIGIARAYDIDLIPYLSSYGAELYSRLQTAAITQVLGFYPGLTWAMLAKPQYANPDSIPAYVNAVNQLIMGSRHTPTAPLLIVQGDNGTLEGTSNDGPEGAGDGVMVAGDVRTLAREYCSRGVPVQYGEVDAGHVATAVPWVGETLQWMTDRFAGAPAPQDCSQIAPGNPLTPVTLS